MKSHRDHRSAAILLCLLGVGMSVASIFAGPNPDVGLKEARPPLRGTKEKAALWDRFQRATFLSRLEFVLDQGVQGEDEHALAACLELLLADDPRLVRAAEQVVSANSRSVGRKALAFSLKAIERDRRVLLSRAARSRFCALKGIAWQLRDGCAYVEVLLRHLDRGPCSHSAVLDLYELRLATAKDLGAEHIPPEVPVTRRGATLFRVDLPAEGGHELRKLRGRWERWLSGIKKSGLEKALQGLFRAREEMLRKSEQRE